MGKALKPIIIGAVIIGAAFLTGGASLVPTIAANTSLTGAAILTGTALSTTFLGGLALSFGAAEILSGLGQLTAKKAGQGAVSLSALDRLQASLNPSAPRTMVFGRTAMATDIRYVEPSGASQEYIDYIIAVASHKATSIEEIWLEDALAWSSTGGTQGIYASFLDVTTILEGGASAYHTVNGGTKWGSAQRLTGCASIHLRIKRSGTNSPFTGGLPGRVTIIGKGLPLYDPRRDSTVPGGSGSMRANDQTTWAYAPSGTEIGQNLALQSLAYLLGWKINGKLAVGSGIPPVRLDLAGYITAANLCDETVTTAAGTQPRYHGAGLISENDDPSAVLSTFATTCNGRFREALGKLALVVMHNDLALAAADPGLGDDEMIGGFTWNPDPSLEQTYNVVRGRFTDPSNASLFQLVDYPEVRLTSTDGIDRVLPLDLPWCQDIAMAQRLAKQTLERKQYQRTLSAVWNMGGWSYKVGDVVPVTLSALGFSRRLFRVEQQIAGFDGTCPMILTEENAAIYAWDADDSPGVTPADPIVYNPLNNPILQMLLSAGIGQVTEGSSDYDPFDPTSAHWHSPPAEGDIYLRFSTDGGVTFADPVLVAGEDGPGQYQQFVFQRSPTQPATPTGDGIPFGWSDGVPAGTDLIWMSVTTQIGGISQTAWSVPAQISGTTGPAGYNSATITLYKRATSTPAVPSATVTYTFAGASLTGVNNGWTQTIPSGTDPVYATAASASSTGPTDTIASGEWASPVIIGQNGTDGVSTATIYLYQRATSAPSLPSATCTYTFSSGSLAGVNNGWLRGIPAGTDPIYVTQATALSTTNTDTILSGEWSAVSIMAQNGINGANGYSTATITIYKRSASTPALPSATCTYTFASATLTGLNNGWSISIPTADGNPLYASAATASAVGATDTIASSEWAGVAILAQDGSAGSPGSPGSPGSAGLAVAPIYIYQRAASTPSLPSVSTTYTFASHTLTGLNNGWTTTVPAGTNPIYVSTATAASTGATDTIANTEWAAAAILAQNGTNGTPGTPGASSFTLVNRANMTINTPNTVTKTGGTNNWDGSVTSLESFINGAAVSWVTPALTEMTMGLNVSPTASTSFPMNFSIVQRIGGTWEIWEGGSSTGISGSYSAGSIFQVIYSGTKVTYLGNGNTLWSHATTGNLRLYLDSSFNTVGGSVNSIAFASAGADGADGSGGGASPGTNVSTVGTNTSIPTPLTMQAGASHTVSYYVHAGYSGGAGTAIVSGKVQYNANGAGWVDVPGQPTNSINISSSIVDAELEGEATYTNTSGAAQLVDFRLVTTKSGAPTVGVFYGLVG